jgi:hypothetical protein
VSECERWSEREREILRDRFFSRSWANCVGEMREGERVFARREREIERG